MVVVKKIKAYCLGVVAVLTIASIAGCGGVGNKAAQRGQQAVPVQATKVLQKDTPLSYEYAGQIQGKNEVLVRASVSGNITEKFVNGGDVVHKGQALFKIDRRPYESALLSAQAELARSEATLSNSRLDTQRYRELYQGSAISEQQMTTQETVERQNEAVVNSQRALVKKAQDNLNDTVVVSPLDGRMDVSDVSVGTYVKSGDTTLASVGTLDSVFVNFSMSESDYLRLMNLYSTDMTNFEWGNDVTLTLSNGQKYPLSGKVEQSDRALASNSGTLTFKAGFDNPKQVLIPGMFARVKISGEMAKNAVLIPQRAVQQLLDKSFVTVVNAENKAEARIVKLGAKVGSFWIVKEGITAGETVVVEGLTKIQDGIALDVTMVTPEDLKLTLGS